MMRISFFRCTCIALLFLSSVNNIKSQITSSWTVTNSVLFPQGVGRLSYAATNDGIFYVFAGSGGNFKWNPSSPTILTTLSTSTVISHCWSQCATFMPDKKIYLMGMDLQAIDYGAVEIFDTETEQFIDHNITIPNRLRHGCVASDYENGLIYYYGGQNYSYEISTNLQVYNIYSGQWTELASNNAITTPLIRNTCAFAPNVINVAGAGYGYLYTFGGTDRFDSVNGPTDKIYRYDVNDDSWAQLTSTPLMYGGAFNLRSIYNSGDEKIYIMGGGTGGDSTSAVVNQFDPDTNSIIEQASLAQSVSDFAINIYAGEIRVWGGRSFGETAVANSQYATITTAEPSTSPTLNPITMATTIEPNGPLEPLTCAVKIKKRSFRWETLMEEGRKMPNITLTRFEVTPTDLSLNIEIELDYLGRAFADDEKLAKFGVTYVLDFEDFDAHKSKINKPGTCENRRAIDFYGITDFNDFWRYSLSPQVTEHIGAAPYLAYPPVDNKLWRMRMKDNSCDTIIYSGTFSWKELRSCAAFLGAPGSNKDYTHISADDEWLNLTGTFYVNVVSPFWYGSTDMNYYRVYQLLSQPFVIAVRSTIYVLGSTGINLNTISIIAVYKEYQETDFKLIVMTETAEYMKLTRDASSTFVFTAGAFNTNDFGMFGTVFSASNTPENTNCLSNKDYICTQLWEISATNINCEEGVNGIGTDFSGTYSLTFSPQCKDDDPSSHCMLWLADHPDISQAGEGIISLSTSLVWKDEICDPQIFEVSLIARMDFYETASYISPVSDSFLYQVGEARVFVQIDTTFPNDNIDIFSTKLINVWICTFNSTLGSPPFVDDGTREGTSSMGCWNSNRDTTYDVDFYHIFSTTTTITIDHGFKQETATEDNKVRFSFIVPHEVARDTLYVHAQIEVTLQEAGHRRRMLLTSGGQTTNKMTHLGDEIAIGINYGQKPVDNPPPQLQEPNYNPNHYNPNHYNYNPPVEPSANVLSLSSPLVIGAVSLLALILACNIVFMCYVNCGGRGRASFVKKLKRKGRGYSEVKNGDSEDSEAKAINVVSE